ncbi:solute carrier family 13 member 2 [Magallana gigas]|uniref:solute carrier family 13 member 2 n=1 Tax=Magallana gigas TaxID=29159 RepID=UPI0033420ABB
MDSVVAFLRNLWAIRSWIFLVLAFVLPFRLIVIGTPEARCAYVIIVMAKLWVTEALPIAVTALMPIFLLPMLGVQRGQDVSKNYVNDTSTLFLGGLFIAAAMEEVNLHRRIAVGVMRVLGSRINTLMLGLMLPTWFLSMWISNTAATSMMLPILVAVTEQMERMEKLDHEHHGDTEDAEEKKNGVASVEAVTMEMDEGSTLRKKSPELKRMSKGFALCVAYGANIGGIATLTGTPPNLVLQGQADIFYARYGKSSSGITYVNWLAFAFPMSLLLLVLAWLYLQVVFLRQKCCQGTESARKKAIQSAVLKEWRALGRIKFAEVEVLVLFCVLALLWIFRNIPNVGGWGELFKDAKTGKVSTARDSTASILVACLLFILPREVPNVFCWFKPSETNPKPGFTPILSWRVAQDKVSWGVIILLGGGFALADAATKSGLSIWIGCKLAVFDFLDPWVMNLLVCLIIAGITEITSNTAIASLAMPIMFELATSVGMHPLYMMISTAVATSFAFCLPVATPPNAIVFSTGFVTILDMGIVGIPMNILSILVLTLAVNTWGKAIFDLGNVPAIFTSGSLEGVCRAVVMTTLDPNSTTTSLSTTP